MKAENELALIVAFYLAKFNREAIANLGFPSFRGAFDEIGRRLGVNPNTVKNMRDQFDPLFGSRAGWYQRELPPSRRRVVEAFGELSEAALRSLVKDSISIDDFSSTDTAKELVHAVSEPTGVYGAERKPLLQRGLTGRLAEEHFLKLFNSDSTPFSGELFDARDLGAGFDFRAR